MTPIAPARWSPRERPVKKKVQVGFGLELTIDIDI